MERDVVAELEPKMLALYRTLDTDDLRRKLRFNEENANDHRAPAIVRESAWTAVRLITAELATRELAA